MARRPDNTFTRTEVTKRLDVSVTKVMEWEREGLITPIREDGRVWLPVAQVMQVAATWTRKRAKRKSSAAPAVTERVFRGKKAAQLFPYFERRASLASIVVDTETDPLLVRELYDEYLLDLEDGRAERERRAETRREHERQLAHERRLERAEVRKFRLKESENLARAGLTKLPPNPPTSMERLRALRDRDARGASGGGGA